MDAAILDEVHRFWFGPLSAPADLAKEKAEIWFTQSDATDREVNQRFGAFLRPAAEADWDLAALSREQAVGLVVLLDQFPRNIFRTSAKAFAFDPVAREIARHLIAAGIERYFYVERGFLFLPFMHSEEIADQDYSVWLYAGQAISVPEPSREAFRNQLDFATKHRDLIRRFGRFPHRNASLARPSTEAEIAFMTEQGRGF
jgi:uncharacterized protein (DUF924 family)